MAPRWSERTAAACRPVRAALFASQAGLAGLAGAPLPAQAAPAEPVVFAAPDGTRFVLVVDPTMPQVHWAVASHAGPAYEPVGLEGLARTTVQLSLLGTWRSGSRDADRERQALGDLDEALQRLVRDPGDVAVAARVRSLEEQASGYADPGAYARVLAGAPVFRPEVVDRGEAVVLVTTTLPAAIDTVARLLVERREQQPLRSLAPTWLDTLAARTRAHDADPDRAVRAELLALALPDHPANRLLARPSGVAPTREQALAVWAATQQPERTVHVLLGGFDAASARAALTAAFARTALPATPQPPPFTARSTGGARRSTLRGAPAVAIGWLLPRDCDRAVLAATAHWLGGGPSSVLGQALQRAGRTKATVLATAPWPQDDGGDTLLLVEARDPDGATGLANLLSTACRGAAAEPPAAAALAATTAALQRRWREATRDPRQLAVELAAAALLWPTRRLAVDGPAPVDGGAMRELLARAVAGSRVIVEVAP